MIPSVYGGFLRRAAALLFDQAILVVLAIFFFSLGILAHLTASDSSEIIVDILEGRATEMAAGGFLLIYYFAVAILVIVYFTYFIGYNGQTPGKMLFGLYVIRANGERMNFRQAFLRWVGYVLSGTAFYLGFLWAIFDRKKQGWHDKLAGSIVIHIPRDRIIPSPPEAAEEDETALHRGIEDYINQRTKERAAPEYPGAAPASPDEEKHLDKEKDIY